MIDTHFATSELIRTLGPRSMSSKTSTVGRPSSMFSRRRFLSLSQGRSGSARQTVQEQFEPFAIR